MENHGNKATAQSLYESSADLMFAALLMNLMASAMEHGLCVVNASRRRNDFAAEIKKPDSLYRVSVCIPNIWECWPDKIFLYSMKCENDFTNEPVKVKWNRVMEEVIVLLRKME